MSLILRVCAAGQRRRCLEEITGLTRTVTYGRYDIGNVQRFAPALQSKWFSTNSDTKNENVTEIYKGLLNKTIRNLKLFSLISSFGACAVQPILLNKAVETGNAGTFVSVWILFVASAFAMPLLINNITKRYVLKLCYDSKEDKYICETYTLFLRKNKIKFTPEDVTKLGTSRMFTTCLIKNNPIFLDRRLFKDPTHYVRITGHDDIFELTTDATQRKETDVKDKKEQKDMQNV